MGKKLIIILGMHRSGTSAVAGALSLLGVDFGRHLMPAAFDNEKGYFENLDVYNVNEAVLSLLGSSWDSVLTLPPEWWRSGELAFYKQHIREIILREFDNGDVFAVKDPRLSRLFPLWQEVLDDLHMDYRFILPVRHPLEVALSLVKRNNFTVEKGALLWTEYNIEAERHTRAHQRIIMSYSEFLERPEDFLQALAGKFSIGDSQRVREAMPAVRGFLEPALRHHRVDASGKDARLPGFVFAVHRLLTDLSSDTKGAPSSVRSIDEIAAEFTRLLNFPAPGDLRNISAPKCEQDMQMMEASKSRRAPASLRYVKAWLSTMKKKAGEWL